MSSPVVNILSNAANALSKIYSPAVAGVQVAIRLIHLIRDLVRAHGPEKVEALLQSMIDKPAGKVDLSEAQAKVAKVVAAREAAEITVPETPKAKASSKKKKKQGV